MPKLIDSKALNLAVLRTSKVQKTMREIADQKLNRQKTELINEFKNHPVSKEISAGSSAQNLSGTLGGYGNLFSFIGFNNGDSPIENWVDFLNRKIRIVRQKNNRPSGRSGFVVQFEVAQITEGDLIANAKMPWESGRSWLTSIERGISGFSNFISKRLGRSSGGVQANQKIRSAQYKRTSYWSPIWVKFVKSLKET